MLSASNDAKMLGLLERIAVALEKIAASPAQGRTETGFAETPKRTKLYERDYPNPTHAEYPDPPYFAD